jgi:hypothetical protein
MSKALCKQNLKTNIYISLCLLFFVLQNTGKANVYYWVGGTGNWSQYNTHWATSTGGLVFHIQSPTPTDTVIFDTNSFSTANDTVYVDSTLITCHDMIWANVTHHPVFINQNYSPNTIFKIYGSLTLSPNMNWKYSGALFFEATSGNNTITSAAQSLGGVTFEGTGGQWTLMDSLTAGITVAAGTFRTNNQKINAVSFHITPTVPVTMYLGTSTIYCGDYTCTGPTVLHADSSHIYTSNFSGGGGYTYNNVTLNNSLGGFWAANCSFNVVTLSNNQNANNSGCSIDSLICPNGLALGGASNAIHYAKADNGLTISISGNSFQHLEASGDANLLSNTTYDTLYFNNLGHIITLGANTTQTINNDLKINASGGFPVSLLSSVAGTQAVIYKATDTVCLNYIYMQDIKATGGAQFYAGQYSSDISNNTGWQWTSCLQPIDNVWPGDANYDLITNNLDILYIGIAYNQTGFVRPGASLTYSAQPCFEWNTTFTNLVNINHADCDGNGIVNATDTTAVSLNYGLANTGRMVAPQQVNATSNTVDLYFAPAQPTYTVGSFVSIPINLGTNATPAQNMYGIAFTLHYDASQIQPGSVNISYNNSWLAPNNNIVHLEKDFYANSYIDVGMARTNQVNVSGSGTIAYLNFQIAGTAIAGPISLSFDNITAMDVNQNTIAINPISDTVTVGLTTVINNVKTCSDNIRIYPNPTVD